MMVVLAPIAYTSSYLRRLGQCRLVNQLDAERSPRPLMRLVTDD
jgi:hypothetical protein